MCHAYRVPMRRDTSLYAAPFVSRCPPPHLMTHLLQRTEPHLDMGDSHRDVKRRRPKAPLVLPDEQKQRKFLKQNLSQYC